MRLSLQKSCIPELSTNYVYVNDVYWPNNDQNLDLVLCSFLENGSKEINAGG